MASIAERLMESQDQRMHDDGDRSRSSRRGPQIEQQVHEPLREIIRDQIPKFLQDAVHKETKPVWENLQKHLRAVERRKRMEAEKESWQKGETPKGQKVYKLPSTFAELDTEAAVRDFTWSTPLGLSYRKQKEALHAKYMEWQAEIDIDLAREQIRKLKDYVSCAHLVAQCRKLVPTVAGFAELELDLDAQLFPSVEITSLVQELYAKMIRKLAEEKEKEKKDKEQQKKDKAELQKLAAATNPREMIKGLVRQTVQDIKADERTNKKNQDNKGGFMIDYVAMFQKDAEEKHVVPRRFTKSDLEDRKKMKSTLPKNGKSPDGSRGLKQNDAKAKGKGKGKSKGKGKGKHDETKQKGKGKSKGKSKGNQHPKGKGKGKGFGKPSGKAKGKGQQQ